MNVHAMAATCSCAMQRASSFRSLSWTFAIFLTAVALSRTAHAVLSEAKVGQLITALTADSQCFPASDMGVQRFEWNVTVDNPTYPFSPKQFRVRLHMYVKYTFWAGKANIKGFLMADTRDGAKQADGVALEPLFTLRALGGSAHDSSHSFPVSCQLHSYWDPPKQAAMVYGFEHSVPLTDDSTHEYELSTGLDLFTVHTWRPYKGLNMIDGRGLEVAPITEPTTNTMREVYVVLKPLYNINPSVYGPLIERHIEYYQALGVDKHVIYLRRDSIVQLLMGNANLHLAAQQGKLIVVEWDGMGEHEVWHRQYDQRVVYSHAMLAFTSMDVLLMNIDLDEYLVTSQPELQDKTIQEIIQTCAGHAADVRIQRHHVVCKACDRDKPEAPLWTGEGTLHPPSHPLTLYHLVNYRDVPKRRSIMNPNFLRAYYVHYGAVSPGWNASYPDSSCMSILHIANMVRVREEADLVEANYVEDHNWMGILRRFKQAPPVADSTLMQQQQQPRRHLLRQWPEAGMQVAAGLFQSLTTMR